MQTLHTPKTAHEELRPRGLPAVSHFGRSALLGAALLALALVAAACSSGGTPTSAANSDIAHGLSAESSGHTQQAINNFTAAAKADPTNPIPYYDLGVIYQQHLKDPAKAASAYNKAILAGNYRPAIYNLAILESSSNPLAAANLYQELLKANPNDPNALFNLGLLLHAQGQTAQGQADISKAVLINPALKNRIPANSGITP
jgi:tetratricopeptide (TPR) repeat protein